MFSLPQPVFVVAKDVFAHTLVVVVCNDMAKRHVDLEVADVDAFAEKREEARAVHPEVVAGKVERRNVRAPIFADVAEEGVEAGACISYDLEAVVCEEVTSDPFAKLLVVSRHAGQLSESLGYVFLCRC
jgi:hypothetical protein